MNKIAIFVLLIVGNYIFAQKSSKNFKKKYPHTKNTITSKPKLEKIKDAVALLIPYKANGKYGFITQNKTIHIPAEYDNVGFFTEDCNLLNSPNQQVRIFGSNHYASVRKDEKDYRINIYGEKVYQYQPSDLAPCTLPYKKQKYNAFRQNGSYGIVEASVFNANIQNFVIYPQYQYLHILEGNDIENPMIVACKENLFGVIDIKGNIIIPFEYSDIKKNFSWKLAHLFEVTKDGKNYYYIDMDNQSYKH